MKFAYLLPCLATMFIANSALAVSLAPRPFLVKVNSSGHTPASWGQTEKCELYGNRVVITRIFGYGTPSSFETKEVVPVSFTGSYAEIMKEVTQEKLTSEGNYLCDGPSTSVYIQSETVGDPVVLYSTGGCGSKKTKREGAVSFMLTNFIDNYCPSTH